MKAVKKVLKAFGLPKKEIIDRNKRFLNLHIDFTSKMSRRGQITIESIFLAVFGFIILASLLPTLDNYIASAAEDADPLTAMLLSWIKPVLVISFLAGVWSYNRVRVWYRQ